MDMHAANNNDGQLKQKQAMLRQHNSLAKVVSRGRRVSLSSNSVEGSSMLQALLSCRYCRRQTACHPSLVRGLALRQNSVPPACAVPLLPLLHPHRSAVCVLTRLKYLDPSTTSHSLSSLSQLRERYGAQAPCCAHPNLPGPAPFFFSAPSCFSCWRRDGRIVY